jgi:uncharacterized membrane protein YcaP (DUF421 family)
MFTMSVPIAEKILRPILVYVFLILLLRVFGKRELAQLNPFDLVVLLSLSNTVQNAIIGDDNSVAGGFIGAFSLMFVNYVVVRFLFRHRRLDQIIEGLITVHELQTVVRRQGFDGIHEVETCILEPGGAFVMKRKVPSDAEEKHQEIVSGIEALKEELRRLEEKLA